MEKNITNNKNFLEAFFDYVIPVPLSDFAAKKDNIRFTDTFEIFKVEKQNGTSL